MSKSKPIVFMLIAAIFPVFVFGCVESGSYGRLTMAGSDMTIEQLQKQWKDYKVSYAGVKVESVNAILFDPRNDGREITLQKYWAPIKDSGELSELLRWIHVFKAEPPSLYRVLGPGGQVFGYLYMLPSTPEIKVVDENTLWIGDLSVRTNETTGIM